MIGELAWEVMLAGLTVGGGVLAWVSRWLWKELQPVVSVINELPELSNDVKELVGEVRMNSGRSLKDAVLRIEAKLAHLDSRQWALLQDVEHAILETNEAGLLVKMNRTYLRWTGRAPSELRGEGWRNAIHPNDVEHVARAWQRAVEQKRDIELMFRLIDLGTGLAHPVRAACFFIAPSGGWVCNIYRVQHDDLAQDHPATRS